MKVGLLRRLVPGDAPPERLRLFEADLYDAATFAPAIAGCQFVFLVATPFLHDATSTKVKKKKNRENSHLTLVHPPSQIKRYIFFTLLIIYFNH